MAWPSDYRIDPTWLNPFPVKYFTAAYKWLPIQYPPEPWQVRDATYPIQAPMPPPGLPVYWWKLPRETWPYKDEMPWEQKSFGAWPASQITMAEDLKPSIWPGPQTTPPWGFIKIRMPGPPDISGDQNPKGNQIAFMNMKIHMRYLSPDEMKVKTAITPMGPKYYFQSEGWNKYELDYREFQVALRMKRRLRVQQMIAEEIARNGGKPKPSKDLFS
jgi:hypothetical protein